MNSKAFLGTIIWIVILFLIISGFIFYNVFKGKIWENKNFFKDKEDNSINNEEIEVITVPNNSVEMSRTTH